MYAERVLSGMRPSGRLHLGHYHGVLKNWVRLQEEYPCLFFVADWHALTTHYDTPEVIENNVWEMLVDWLAAGIDPAQSTLFIQSHVPEHAELHLLLSMMTPLGWLERVPTWKEQQEKIEGRDLSTYGFLGYPLLQSADILIYRADKIPVGEDQVPHVEITREIARRFNHLYGREPGFEDKAKDAVRKLGAKRARMYHELRTRFQQEGDEDALEQAKALLDETQNLSLGDRERLYGYLEGSGKMIMVEPEALLTPAARMRRTDPGEPERCPVWQLHAIYSDESTLDWVQKGCRSAGIGCLECKQPLLESILREQEELHERAQPYLDDPTLVRSIIADGCERARKMAQETMRDVREAMGLDYG